MEEAKADIVGLWALKFLISKVRKKYYISAVVWFTGLLVMYEELGYPIDACSNFLGKKIN